MENMSLSDIAAVTGNEGFGGNGAWMLIVLFVLIFGWGGFGGRGSDAATAATQQEILYGQQFQGLNQAINKVGDGLASLGYSQLQQMDSNTASINGNVVNEGRAIQTQISQCCCDNVAANAAVKEAIHAEGEATRAMLQQNKIESLQAQVNELKTQNMFCGVPKINPYGYGVYPLNNCCGG